jgi:hypothetical protein
MIFDSYPPWNLEKIKRGFKNLAECGGIRGVDDTSSLFSRMVKSVQDHPDVVNSYTIINF